MRVHDRLTFYVSRIRGFAKKYTPLPRGMRLFIAVAAIFAVFTVLIQMSAPKQSESASTELLMGSLVGVFHNGKHITNCSVGPAVKSDKGKGFLFAGHCGEADDIVTDGPYDTSPRIGTIADAIQHVDAGHYEDSAVVYTTNTSVSSRLGIGVYPFRTVSVDELTLRRSDGDVRVCADGAVSGTRCGKLNGINASTGLISVAFPSSNGDSGGPAYISSNGHTELLGIVVRTFVTSEGESGSLIASLDQVLERHPGLHVILDET